MPRFKITIEYDGTGLAGWQAQNDHYSVQAALQNALSKAGNGQVVEVYGSGRTDAGVHATAQIAHFDIEGEWAPFRIKEAANFYLKQDERLPHRAQISIVAAEVAEAEFHARFNATKRHYLYRVINRREHLALDGNRAWNIPEKLDVEKMHDAAQVLIGNHDFTSLRSTECQSKSPVKTLDFIDIKRVGDLIEYRLSARSFLHHQVRNIVGTLRLVGNGKWDKANLTAALEAKDRRAAGETAPAQGLYLIRVDY